MDNRSRTEYSILNIATGMGGYILSVLLSLVNRMVFTRCLTAEYLGISGLLSNVLSMLSLTELGVSGAIVYALYKPLAERDEPKIAALVQLFGKLYRIIGTVIFTLGMLIMPVLTQIIGGQPDISESIYLIYGIYLFNSASSYFFTYRSTMLVAAQQNYLVTGLNYIVLCVQSLVQMVFLYLTRNYIGYLLIQAGFSLLYNVLVSRLAVKKYPFIAQKSSYALTKEEQRHIFKDTKDLLIYKISGILVNSTDNLIITAFSGLATTGLASNYTLLVTTLNSLLGQIFNGIGSSVGNLNAVESQEKKYKTLKMLNLLNFCFFGWAALGIVFVSSDLVHLLFGKAYVLSIDIPLIMALNFYTVGMQNAIWTFKHTMGLFRYGRFTQIGTALLNLLLSMILGRYFGLFGILLATFIARLFTNLWYDPYIIFKVAFKKNPLSYLGKYLYYLLILSISGGVCAWVNSFVFGGLLVQILCKAIVCTVVFFTVFVISCWNMEEFKDALRLVFKVLGFLRGKFFRRKGIDG